MAEDATQETFLKAIQYLDNYVQIRLCLPSGGIGLKNSFYFELTDFSFLQLGTLSIWSPYVVIGAAAIEIFLFLIFTVRSYSRHEAAQPIHTNCTTASLAAHHNSPNVNIPCVSRKYSLWPLLARGFFLWFILTYC